MAKTKKTKKTKAGKAFSDLLYFLSVAEYLENDGQQKMADKIRKKVDVVGYLLLSK